MRAEIVTDRERDGFTGYFYPAEGTDRCMVVLAGDEGCDALDRAFAGWLTRRQRCHALCVNLQQDPEDDTGVHGWPLEYVEAAAAWLRRKGVEKLGLLGMSIPAALALSAAARIPDFSLVIAFSPCDFVPWGFHQGRLGKARKAEWPSGGSAFSWRGEELPFQPAGLEPEAYWARFNGDSKRWRELHSIGVFEYSEAVRPIPAERIHGRLVLIGAEDDSMWDSARYIRRMTARLERLGAAERAEAWIYPCGTHLLVPEELLRCAFPVGGGLISQLFASGRKYPGECRRARKDLEIKLTALFRQW